MLSRKHIYLIMTVSLGLLPLQGPRRLQRQDSDPQATAARTSIRGCRRTLKATAWPTLTPAALKGWLVQMGFFATSHTEKPVLGKRAFPTPKTSCVFRQADTGHEGHFVICFLLNQMSRISRQTRSLIAYYGSFPLHSTGTEYTNNK